MSYRPLRTSAEQDTVLDELVRLAEPGAVAILDLDGCLFDTRHRTVAILQAFANISGHLGVARVQAHHFQDREFRRTFRTAGIPGDVADDLADPARAFWADRFFTADFLPFDHPMPGGRRLVEALRVRGAHIVYLTGRTHAVRAATEAQLRRFGFPYDIAGVDLLTKPSDAMTDLAFKDSAFDAIAAFGRVVLALDNEPANVNALSDRFPEATVVFVHTDHTDLPVVPYHHLPQISGFLRTTDL